MPLTLQDGREYTLIMSPERLPLHLREIPGLCTREVTEWHGIPLRALYFVEITLPPNQATVSSRKGPVILLPGSWDPRQGEYSDNLIRSLLVDAGAPAVMEGHYRHDGQDGYVEPAGLVEDLASIYLARESPPTVIALCFACLFAMEALLVARNQDPAPPIAGVLLIGQGVPGFLNAIGRTALRSHINMKVGAEARHLIYTGHSHTAGNNARGEAYARASRLVAAMTEADPATPIQPFPVPVDALYFRLDVSSGRGRALVRQVFGITTKNPLIPGYHRSLRRRSPADPMIVQFYLRSQAHSREDTSATTGSGE